MPRKPADVDRHVAARVRKRRTELKISRKKLAELINVPMSQMRRYEEKKDVISVAVLWRIARALEVEVKYFFEN